MNSFVRVDAIIDSLKKSPIFAMSLGAHELYHSNFWAWIAENYAMEFVELFFPILKGKTVQVNWEAGNRDITFECDGKSYVIENKLKSMPTKEQLCKYEKGLAGKFQGGVLTGILNPDFIENFTNWRFYLIKK